MEQTSEETEEEHHFRQDKQDHSELESFLNFTCVETSARFFRNVQPSHKKKD